MKRWTDVVVALMFLVFAQGAPPVAAEQPADSRTRTPVAVPQLEIVASRKVIGPGDDIEASYTYTHPGGSFVTVLPSVSWTVKDASGKTLTEVPAGETVLPKSPLLADSIGAKNGQATIEPDREWPLGSLVLQAVLEVPEGMYKASGKGGPAITAGGFSSNAVGVVVKEKGWREKTYRRCVTTLEKTMREKFKPHAFEFPEARDLDEAVVTADENGASARIKMDVSRLVVNQETKTARLRTLPGSFTVYAGDPYSPPESAPPAVGEVEDGFVLVWFVVDTHNGWFDRKADALSAEALKELQGREASTGSGTVREKEGLTLLNHRLWARRRFPR